MKIAIHRSKWGFSADWIRYCEENGINHKVVNCYESDIIEQLRDCDILLWHHHHAIGKDILFARQLMNAVEQSGMEVFPDFNTAWHFDDKVGQKYLLEAVKAPLCPTFVSYDEEEALNWVKGTSFPKVFKLRNGAGSSNVRLVKSAKEAEQLVYKAFSSGFEPYNRWGDLRENLRRFKKDQVGLMKVLKSIKRVFVSTDYSRTMGRERGYVLFQEYLPGNDFDIRIITIGDKALGIKRLVRPGDFRASGSGYILYEKAEIDERCVRIAFETTEKLKGQCLAYDFVFTPAGEPQIVEINYGFEHTAYLDCSGYWDHNLQWHQEKFNTAYWIIEMMINEYQG